MKFLNVQTLMHGYLCLGHAAQLSSNHPEKRKRESDVVKVIKSDGVVDIYRKAIKASELMHQFPGHLVCHSHSFFIGRKIPPVSPQHKLQLGHTYFVLPIHFFQTVLSFVTMASSFSSLNSSTPSNKEFIMGTCQVFEIRKAPSGGLQVRVSDEFVSKLIRQEKQLHNNKNPQEEQHGGMIQYSICTTTELQKDYTQLVSYRQWKPKLETIKESKKKKLSFGIKRKNNKSLRSKNHDKPKPKPSKTHKSKRHEHHHAKCPKSKVKAKKIRGGDCALT